MSRLVAALFFVSACGASSIGDESLGPDASLEDPGEDEVCEPFAAATCFDGDVYWEDTCGVRGERIAECTGNTVCITGSDQCCEPAQSTGSVPDQSFPVELAFGHPNSGAEYQVRYEVISDPGSGSFIWLMSDLYIDGSRVLVGPKTDSVTAGPNGEQKSVIMSLMGANLDATNVKAGSSGSTVEVTAGLVGPRTYFEWGVGTYIMTLTRGAASPEHNGDWFDLEIAPEGQPSGSKYLGSIAVPRANPAVPAQIDARSGVFMQTYGGQSDYSEFAAFTLRMTPTIDDAGLIDVGSRYRTDENGDEFANAEVHMDGEAVYMGLGLGVNKCTPGGPLAL